MASAALVKVKEALASTRARMAKYKESVEGIVPEAVSAAEVQVGAAAAGFVDETYGTADSNGIKEAKFGSVPANVAVGGGMIVAGAAGLAGKHGSHLWDVGKGLLAGYSYNFGRTMAIDYRNSKGAAGT